MSQTDPVQEFYTDLDDWWGQLWGNRIAAKAPNKEIKESSISMSFDFQSI